MGYTAVQLPPVILRNMLENRAGIPRILRINLKSPRAALNTAQLPAGNVGFNRAGYGLCSLLDEATAAAEAMAMAKRVNN